MFPELKIISKACEFPGMSLVAKVSRPFLTPLQNVAQQSLLPLGAQLVEIVDGRMSDGSRQWVLNTKEKLVTVIETSDSIACNCLDKVTLRRRIIHEETIIRQVCAQNKILLFLMINNQYCSCFRRLFPHQNQGSLLRMWQITLGVSHLFNLALTSSTSGQAFSLCSACSASSSPSLPSPLSL